MNDTYTPYVGVGYVHDHKNIKKIKK